MEACGRLDQFRKRGMDDSLQRSIVKKAFGPENVERLKGLVAKFEGAIQTLDADLVAAVTASAPALGIPCTTFSADISSAVPAAVLRQQCRQQLEQDTVRTRRSMGSVS